MNQSSISNPSYTSFSTRTGFLGALWSISMRLVSLPIRKDGVRGELFQRRQYCSRMSPRGDWDMHDADAPDDEVAGQYWPQLHQWRSKHRQPLHRRMLHHRPLQHKKRLLRRKGCRSSSTCVSHVADRQTLTSIGIVLSSHPPDLRLHDFFEPVRLLTVGSLHFCKEHP